MGGLTFGQCPPHLTLTPAVLRAQPCSPGCGTEEAGLVLRKELVPYLMWQAWMAPPQGALNLVYSSDLGCH